MAPYWSEQYGNPSSHHRTGYAAARAVETARETLADLLGVAPSAVVFTACGSESNNLALRGVMLAAREAGRGRHLITSAIEHSAVLATARQLRDHFGFDLTVLPVDGEGPYTSGRRGRGPAPRHCPDQRHGRQQRDRHASSPGPKSARWPASMVWCSTPTPCSWLPRGAGIWPKNPLT
jgi:hypothetical protein